MNTKTTNLLLFILVVLNGYLIYSRFSGIKKQKELKKERTDYMALNENSGAERLAAILDFNEWQHLKLDTLYRNHLRWMGGYEETRARIEQNLWKCFLSIPMDTAKAIADVDSIGKLRDAMQKALFYYYFNISKLCNESQKKKFETFIGSITDQLRYNHNSLCKVYGCRMDTN